MIGWIDCEDSLNWIKTVEAFLAYSFNISARMPLHGDFIHCIDGNKDETHPAIDTGKREEREDGTYRYIKWVTNDKFTWVSESRVVVLSRKRQRSKTQRLSEGGGMPSAAKQARSEDDDSHAALSSSGWRNRSKRSPKAPRRRTFPRRKMAIKPQPVFLSDMSTNSDESDDVASSYDERKPAYKKSTRTNTPIHRSPRNKRQNTTGGGKETSVSSTSYAHACNRYAFQTDCQASPLRN